MVWLHLGFFRTKVLPSKNPGLHSSPIQSNLFTNTGYKVPQESVGCSLTSILLLRYSIKDTTVCTYLTITSRTVLFSPNTLRIGRKYYCTARDCQICTYSGVLNWISQQQNLIKHDSVIFGRSAVWQTPKNCAFNHNLCDAEMTTAVGEDSIVTSSRQVVG